MTPSEYAAEVMDSVRRDWDSNDIPTARMLEALKLNGKKPDRVRRWLLMAVTLPQLSEAMEVEFK